MELNFSVFLAAVGINVFDFYYFWDILYNFNQPIKLINFNHINDLLAEVLGKFRADFLDQLRILCV